MFAFAVLLSDANLFLPWISSFIAYLTDETEEDDNNQEYVEETNRDAVMIAAAMLVSTDVVPKVNISFLCSRFWYILHFITQKKVFSFDFWSFSLAEIFYMSNLSQLFAWIY